MVGRFGRLQLRPDFHVGVEGSLQEQAQGLWLGAAFGLSRFDEHLFVDAADQAIGLPHIPGLIRVRIGHAADQHRTDKVERCLEDAELDQRLDLQMPRSWRIKTIGVHFRSQHIKIVERAIATQAFGEVLQQIEASAPHRLGARNYVQQR